MQRPLGMACVAPIHSLQRKTEARARSWARGRVQGCAPTRSDRASASHGACALRAWCVRTRGRGRENRSADGWAPYVGERKERKEASSLLG
jgi:hypothetical protein